MPTSPSIETKPSPRTPAYWEIASPAERTPTRVFARAKDVSATVAREIADLIRAKAATGERCVLGLATGSTPTGVYDELVRLHREDGLSFKDVVTFNLDEYWPMQPHELQSYRRFMREHLFDRIDIDPANAHIPDGTASEDEVRAMCDAYERMIRAAGGIDLQLLGIGRTGHIGFNEPGSARTSRTRLITLDRVTRKDAASDFFGEENVPTRAVTMGVGTILEAKRVVMMAFGEGKSPVVARAIELHRGELPAGARERAGLSRPRRRRRARALQGAVGEREPQREPRSRVGRRPHAQGRHLARAHHEEGDSQADRRGLQRASPAGPSRRPRQGVRPEHLGVPRSAALDHGLARRQARVSQAGGRHRSPRRRDLPEARPHLQPAPGRRRHLDGRHADPTRRSRT